MAVKIKMTWKEMIGKTFGDWEILERDYNPTSTQHSTFFKCKCIRCGEIVSVSRSTIVNNPSTQHKKCWGKNRRTLDDKLIGQTFGFLTVLERDEEWKSVHPKFKCICRCGKCNNKIVSVRADNLQGKNKGDGKIGRTISCGLANISSGELKIQALLNEFQINYQYQYTIPDFSLYSKFDFAILNSDGTLLKLIEFDGEQHFNAVELFGGEEQLKIQQERDNNKNEYCKKHNIPLLRIPYYDFDKIDIDYLLNNVSVF